MTVIHVQCHAYLIVHFQGVSLHIFDHIYFFPLTYATVLFTRTSTEYIFVAALTHHNILLRKLQDLVIPVCEGVPNNKFDFHMSNKKKLKTLWHIEVPTLIGRVEAIVSIASQIV